MVAAVRKKAIQSIRLRSGLRCASHRPAAAWSLFMAQRPVVDVGSRTRKRLGCSIRGSLFFTTPIKEMGHLID
jgi:hypothetical protein